MANEIEKQQVRRFPWVNPAGPGGAGAAGMTADELKVHQGGVRPPDRDGLIVPSRGPMEFIAPSTSSEILRLAVPEAANPFATPTGPRHDHMLIRKVLQRAGTDITRAINNLLRSPLPTMKPEATDRMRASVKREENMHVLLRPLLAMQDDIYGRLVGTQQG